MGRRELRPLKAQLGYLKTAEGSALFQMGDTWVLCTATVSDTVPAWLKGTGSGWVTAEYAMLPRATRERKVREIRAGRPDSRSVEISRMIGRALRGVVDLGKLGEHTIVVDCDVIQADGGTRTAAINGGFLALYQAVEFMRSQGLIQENPIREFVAAVSVGIVDGEPVLDLSYEEDSRAEVDLNVAMTESGRIVEIQGTGEGRPFSRSELDALLDLAWEGIRKILSFQREVLGKS